MDTTSPASFGHRPLRRRGAGAHAPLAPSGIAGIDPEWLSSTIGAIYDCVLSPQNWREVIAMIANEFGFASGTLAVAQFSPGVQQVVAAYNYDDAWLAAAGEYAEDSIDLWGGPAQADAFPLGEPIQFTTLRSLPEASAFRYYRDILEPRGLNEAALVVLAREPRVLGYIAFNRHKSASPMGKQEMEGLRLLAPHLRRAVTISNLFDLRAVEGATFRSVLDSMGCAVVLVDEALGIIHTNPAADAMLLEGAFIESEEGRLALADRPIQHALQSAVQLSATNEAMLGQRGIGIPVRSGGEASGILHVMPLRRRELRGRSLQLAVAAVFVEPSGKGPTPMEAIALLYDLTPAEGKIFAAIAEGRTLNHTAGVLGIAKSTARTHLLRIFAKTGCKRQAELAALAARLSLHL